MLTLQTTSKLITPEGETVEFTLERFLNDFLPLKEEVLKSSNFTRIGVFNSLSDRYNKALDFGLRHFGEGIESFL